MIGNLINKFEEMPEQNVETFNEVFKDCPISGYDPKSTVEIGELANTARKITINNTETFWHDMLNARVEIKDKRARNSSKAIRLFDSENRFIGEFDSTETASATLGISRSTFNHKIVEGKLYREFIKELQ